MSMTTVPGSSNDTVDTDNMVRLTKTYGNENTTVLFAAAYCDDGVINNIPGGKFFDHGNGKRPSFSYHKCGVVASETDVHCCDAPLRRRAVHLLVWIEADEAWDMWYVDSCSSVRQGKRMIDEILESGIIPAR